MKLLIRLNTIARTLLSPRLVSISSRSMSETQHDSHKSDLKKKPDLRRAALDDRPKKIILAACLLALLYMYPTILKPLFGIESQDKKIDKQRIEEIQQKLEQYRPDNMPQWSSPFGPKPGKNELIFSMDLLNCIICGDQIAG